MTASRRQVLRLAGGFGAGAALMLSGCGTAPPPLPPAEASLYRVGTGDRLRLIVFGQAELSGVYGVSDGGQLALPLVGNLPVRGLTVPEAEDLIRRRLTEGGFVVGPSVSLEVEAFRPFFILGEVARPGQYPYVPGMTVMTAAAIGGGFTRRARTEWMTVTRLVEGKGADGSVGPAGLVLPGDVILVHERYF